MRNRRAWFKRLAAVVATIALIGGCKSEQTSLPGHLWYYNIVSNRSEILAANGKRKPQDLTGDNDARPWPDGSQYIKYDFTHGDTDFINIIRTSDGETIYRVAVPSFSGLLQPSPISKSIVSLQYFKESFDTKGAFFVIDLSNGKILHQSLDPRPKSKEKFGYSWLPDGKIMRIDKETGVMETVNMGGDWVKSGRLSIPDGRKLWRFSVSHSGSKIAAIYMDYDYSKYATEKANNNSDLWVANIDGSDQHRVTRGGMTYKVFWAPDDSKLLFNMSTRFCNDLRCPGQTSWWLANSSETSIPALRDGSSYDNVTQLLYLNSSDNRVAVGGFAEIRGWVE